MAKKAAEKTFVLECCRVTTERATVTVTAENLDEACDKAEKLLEEGDEDVDVDLGHWEIDEDDGR